MRLTRPSPALLPTAALLAALAAPPALFAQHDGGAYDARDYSNVSDTSLTNAIKAIEQSVGGRVLEVRLLHSHGPGFAAVVSKGQDLINVRYTEPSRQVDKLAVSETPQWMTDWMLREDAKDIRKATVAPADAVQKVQQAMGAPAVDIGLARPLSGGNSVLAYNVEVVKDGTPQRVAIDANTGQMIADPQSLLTPWTPEHLAQQDESKQR